MPTVMGLRDGCEWASVQSGALPVTVTFVEAFLRVPADDCDQACRQRDMANSQYALLKLSTERLSGSSYVSNQTKLM